MTRFARRARSARPKREYQWFGGTSGALVETVGDTSVGDILQLRPAFLSADARTTSKAVRLVLHAQIRRINTTVVGAPCFVVTQAPVDSAGNLTDVLELNNDDPFVWGNKRILQCGLLPIPPVNHTSVSTTDIDRSVVTESFDFKINRMMDWKRECLALQINTDISGVVNVVFTWRILVQY